jgi:tripartite-type tricarboxylate transporter receptor subunit TctC
MTTIRRRSLLLSAGLLAAPAVRAQGAWPNRPIRMIVPYTPGAATDAMARLAAQKLGEKLGVNVVVENRSGGNGMVGSLAVKEAAPDGYTIMGSASTLPLARHVLREAPLDPQADFIPLVRSARGPCVLVMSPKLAPNNITELVAAVKADPNRWSFATSSLGAAGHLAGVEFNRVAGTAIEVVPYRGSAPALTDVAAGNAQLMFDPVLATLPMVRAGQLKGLAIATLQRTPLAPELPTATEAGMPGFEFYSWYGVWAPRGVPREIAERMNAALTEGLNDAPTRERLTGLGFEPVRESIDEIERYIAAEVPRNAELLRLAKFEPQ